MAKNVKRFVGTSIEEVSKEFDGFFSKSADPHSPVTISLGWDGTDFVFDCEYDDTIFHG